MRSNATTVEEYLAELPEDRRAAVSAMRERRSVSTFLAMHRTVSQGR